MNKPTGRTPLPPERKKRPCTVFLIPADLATITERYGSLQAAFGYLLQHTPRRDTMQDALKLIRDSAMDALGEGAVCGGKSSNK